MTGFRLPSGGQIDRSQPLSFQFDGTAMTGYSGDTLASALLANGVRTVGRSFKYHRRRGIVGAGVEDAGALVTVGTAGRSVPNLKPATVPLYEGLVATPVNVWPSLEMDVRALHQWIAPLLPAGFYNKTFTWPSWHLFEGAIRRAAGFGTAPSAPDPDRYAKAHLSVDVAIVGAGPAGLTAALALATSGVSVVVIDANPRPGGSLALTDPAWAREASATLSRAGVRVLTNSTAFGLYDHGLLGVVEQCAPPGAELSAGRVRERLWLIRAARCLLAPGLIERPLVFANNDRPGVMLAQAVRRYLTVYGVAPAQRWVIATVGDEGHRCAVDLLAAGLDVAAIVDHRAAVTSPAVAAATAAGIPIEWQARLTATLGRRGVEGARIALASGSTRTVACTGVAVHGGWSPTVHLYSQAGGRLAWDDARAAFVPSTPVARVETAFGWSVGEACAAGAAAAARVAQAFQRSTVAVALPTAPPADAPLQPLWEASGAEASAFVDLLSDVTARDIRLAAQENYVSVEHLKRYTTTGMAPDQGKTSNLPALALMAAATDRTIPEVGTTRFRPPFEPISLGVLAHSRRGALLAPSLTLPLAREHLGLGAEMEEYGRWQRPALYPRRGERREETLVREVLAVRNGVGVFDASPLGKIELTGPDAARLLDFISVQTLSTLPVGRVRYHVMLTETGTVLDDGVCARLGPEHFLLSPSSAMASTVATLLDELLQCDFPAWRCLATAVTQGWAVLTLTGPNALALLSALGTDLPLSTLPHMSIATGRVAGLPARVARVSFTGEASYEIAVPSTAAQTLWHAIWAAGTVFDLQPIGLESVLVLRLEKGYLIHGVDTDGETTPDDLGYGGGIARKASDFIGRRSLLRPEQRRSGRRQLVGLTPEDGVTVLPAGGHVLLDDGTPPSDGWVTSSAYSPTLARPVAIGLVADGRARMGARCQIADGDRRIPARIAALCAWDPEGRRLHG